jgi:hypothetical protein
VAVRTSSIDTRAIRDPDVAFAIEICTPQSLIYRSRADEPRKLVCRF